MVRLPHSWGIGSGCPTERVTGRGPFFTCDKAFPKSPPSLSPKHQTCCVSRQTPAMPSMAPRHVWCVDRCARSCKPSLLPPVHLPVPPAPHSEVLSNVVRAAQSLLGRLHDLWPRTVKGGHLASASPSLAHHRMERKNPPGCIRCVFLPFCPELQDLRHQGGK